MLGLKKSNPRFWRENWWNRGLKKRVVEIADIVTWIEAFTIFFMILGHTVPFRCKEIN